MTETAHALARRLLADLAVATDDSPGVTRDPFGPGEGAMHAAMAAEGGRLGLEVSADHFGNLFVTLPGRDRAAPAVIVGSHMDSVPHGGAYDGAAGAIMALAALADLRARGVRPTCDVVAMAIRAEEMIWFAEPYPGSRAAFGRLPPDAPDRARRFDTGRTLAEHMADCGLDAEGVRRSRRSLDPARIRAFVEPHIEQGPRLLAEGVPLGIVTAIRGARRCRFGRILGAWDHAGGAPMADRRDAVMAGAAFVAWLDARWRAEAAAGRDLTMTVGEFWTPPAMHGVTKVPGEVRFTLDFRSDDAALLDAVEADLRAEAARLSAERGVTLDPGPATRAEPAAMDADLRARLAAAAAAEGVAALAMPSGGGHDAATFAAEGVPTAMLFLRNANGSHNPDEHLADADVAAGLRVLSRMLGELVA